MRLVLAVGIDGEDDVVLVEVAFGHAPSDLLEGGVVGGGHPAVVIEEERMDVRMNVAPAKDELLGAIGGPIIDDDDLVDAGLEGVKYADDCGFFVVCRDDSDEAQ